MTDLSMNPVVIGDRWYPHQGAAWYEQTVEVCGIRFGLKFPTDGFRHYEATYNHKYQSITVHEVMGAMWNRFTGTIRTRQGEVKITKRFAEEFVTEFNARFN